MKYSVIQIFGNGLKRVAIVGLAVLDVAALGKIQTELRLLSDGAGTRALETGATQ